jgi:hypothetical protein
MTNRLLLLGCLLATTSAACGGTTGTAPSSVTPASAEAKEAQIASVWRSKCGACHVPVEPGSRKRDEIETALQRHRKRLRLTDDQWSQLVDFLAPPQTQRADAQ